MKRMLLTFLTVTILNVCSSIPACLADNTWQTIGPFGAWIMALAIDSNNSQIMYAATYGNGVFKSTNGGASWATVNNGINVKSLYTIAIDPNDSQTIYTWGERLYKSTDGGVSWTTGGDWGVVMSNAKNLVIDPHDSKTIYAGTASNGIYKSTDSGSTWLAVNSGMATANIQSLTIDPGNRLTLYASTSGSGVFKSTNGGSSWQTINSGMTESNILSLAIDPGNSQIIYAGASSNGIYKSTNGGVSWTLLNSTVGSIVVSGVLAIDPKQSQTIYAGFSGIGVYKSVNGGASWTSAGTGITNAEIWCLAVDPGNEGTVFAGTVTKGVFKTANGGSSWAAVNNGLTNTSISSVAIARTNTQTIYAGAPSGVFKSTNSGSTWAAANSGLPSNNVQALALDPSDSQSKTIFAGVLNYGVYKSTDAGLTWIANNNGLTFSKDLPYLYSVTSLAVDPVDSQTIYAGIDESTFYGVQGTYGGGIFKSTNGGASWQTVNNGLTFTYNGTTHTYAIKSIVIDKISRTIYAGGYNEYYNGGLSDYGGVFKSTDGGTSWTRITSGMTNTNIHSLVIDPNSSQIIYAGTGETSSFTQVGNINVGGGVYKSTNGGSSWTKLNTGDKNNAVCSIAVDPVNSQIIYAGARVVLKSSNGGATWSEFNSGMPDMFPGCVPAITIDPVDSRTIYVGSQGAYKTLLSDDVPALTGSTTTTFSVGVSGSFQLSASGWPAPQFSTSGALPSGISFDPVTGILSGTPASGSAGTYPLLVTASNGIPPDASRGLTLTVLPATSLTAVITAPVNGAKPNALAGITGSASGSGLSKVEVQITDGSYYLQSNGAFTPTPVWLTAAGTAPWNLNTSTVSWREGIIYTIQARASDGAATSLPASASFTMVVPTGKSGSILSLTLTPDTIRAGDSSTISGVLLKADNSPLSGQTVTLIITPPSTSTTPNPASTITTLTTDSSGGFTSGALAYSTPGVYLVQVRYEGTSTVAASFTSQALGVTPQSGYAIIVSGKATDNSLLDLHTASTDSIYATLVNKRGFLASNITYLKSTTTAAVTKQQIQDAITVWAKGKLTAAPAPLYLFLIDHGTTTGFVLGDQTVTPDDLKGYLDTLEADSSVVASGALDSYKRFVIIGTCYSGTFINKISKAGRVVLTSAAADERSIAGFSIYNSATSTTFSGGEYFIDTLINFLGRGDSFKAAITQSSSNVALRDPRTVTAGFHSGVYDTLAQHPLLDDNGDATGSYNLDGSADGSQAALLTLGVGKRSIGNPADITAVTPTAFIPADQGTVYPLWLQVADSSRVAKAWMEIRTPNTAVAGGSTSGQVIPSLVTLPLYYDGNQWQNSYTFSASGTYNILYYTQDNQTGDISPAAHTVIYKKLAGNTTPALLNLLSPDDNSAQSPLFSLSWQEVSSVNPLTYTLLVSTDQSFGTTVYSEEGIPQAATYIADGKLKNSSGSYYCQSSNDTWCYWKIKAIDSYGSVTESTIRRFTTVLTNGLPGLLKGYVRSSASGAPIPGASLSVGALRATTLSNGAYLMTVPTGTVTITATATGYGSKAISNLTATAGTVLSNDVSLTAVAVSAKPGDCDNSGTVTIAEVQSSINMFLGLKTVDACVDQDGTGAVSISEVQKVINSFLGL